MIKSAASELPRFRNVYDSFPTRKRANSQITTQPFPILQQMVDATVDATFKTNISENTIDSLHVHVQITYHRASDDCLIKGEKTVFIDS